MHTTIRLRGMVLEPGDIAEDGCDGIVMIEENVETNLKLDNEYCEHLCDCCKPERAMGCYD